MLRDAGQSESFFFLQLLHKPVNVLGGGSLNILFDAACLQLDTSDATWPYTHHTAIRAMGWGWGEGMSLVTGQVAWRWVA